MAGRRGISLLDLINPLPGSQSLVPPTVAAQIEKLSVIDFRSTTSPDAHVYSGLIQSAADVGLPSLREWPVEAPGLNVGVPFQLAVKRIGQQAGQNLEPAPLDFRLDLFLDRVAITVPGLKPALKVDAANASPPHLLHDPKREKVKIVGSGVLRISPSADGGPLAVRFVDAPDPFDPDAPTGPVFRLNFEPPHFFLGQTEFGLTVDRLTFDDSETFTPPEIVARGQPAEWRGVAINEATVYFPREAPVVGDLSAGVRNVLLGSPFGLQGDLQIDFGRSLVSGQAVQFVQQDVNGGADLPLPVAVADGTGGRDFVVSLAQGTKGEARVRGRFVPAASGPTARWFFPDNTDFDGNETPYFSVKPGDLVLFQGIETVDGGPVGSPGQFFTFAATGGVQHPPAIDVGRQPGAAIATSVLHVSGTAADMRGLLFMASIPQGGPDPASLVWQLDGQTEVHGGQFTMDTPPDTGTTSLTLTDANGRVRRVKVETLSAGELIFGSPTGAVRADGSEASVRAIAASYDLDTFLADDDLKPADEAATLASQPDQPADPVIPGGVIADLVLTPSPTLNPVSNSTTLPSGTLDETAYTRLVQIEMVYDTVNEFAWGDSEPDQPTDPNVGTSFDDRLAWWMGRFPGAQFLVIGRCDDLDTDEYNAGLAQRRAEEFADRLRGYIPTIPNMPASTKVVSRGEQDPALGDVATVQADIALVGSGVPPIPVSGDDSASAAAADPYGFAPGRLIKQRVPKAIPNGYPNDPGKDDPNRPAVLDHGERPRYRRVDIYAVGGTPTSDAPIEVPDGALFDPQLRRILAPGPDVTTLKSQKPRDPSLPFHVKILVRWDSPTVVELSDAIPTLAELTVEWPGGPIALPNGTQVTPRAVDDPQREIFTFVGRWTYDARSGQTLFSLALDSTGDPNGLAVICRADDPGDTGALVLATALALGPALISGIQADDLQGAGVRIGALLAASTLAAAFAKNGEAVLFGLEVEVRLLDGSHQVAGGRLRLLVDYTVSIGFEASSGGVSIASDPIKPIKVRYKNVGIEIDDSKEGLDKFGLVFEDVSFEIVDPGKWTINGPLGELLRVAGSRAGSGSTWYELDLAFALDLGVITVTGATIRLTFEPGANGQPGVTVELRGLGVLVEIPGTLKGGGKLAIGAGGQLSALLDVEVIPAKIQVVGALQMIPPMTQIDVGVRFAAGLPLGASGLGLYGFVGRFVSNGTRALNTGIADPIQREIAWYDAPLAQKYVPQAGQWALGLGALVGTLPDGAFMFNALGMFVVEHPSPSVVFGIDAHFVSQPGLPTDNPPPLPPGSVPPPRILGLVAIDTEGTKLAVRGSYKVPPIIDVNVPVNGFFPAAPSPLPFYLRVGADGFEGRTGDPATMTFLPGLLNQRASAFLMIEEKQLHKLGGDDRFNFDGLSVGFGATWGINWVAGPIRLTASAKVLVGVGMKPALIMGSIAVRGELSLMVVSVSATGDILLKLKEDEHRLEGSFCGKVDMLFSSIEGCVSISIGSAPGAAIPPPPPPLTGIELTDRRGIVTAAAVPSTANIGPPNTAWPDTVPVLHFAHYAETALNNSPFAPSPEIPGPVWSGTSELKYAYRITGIRLLKREGANFVAVPGPLDSAWWLPSYRPGVSDAGDSAPSEHEGRDLALLYWHPAPWARNLGEDGGAAPGDPANTVGRVCEPPPKPDRNCAYGEDARRTGVDRVEIAPESPSAPPFPSYFRVRGKESYADVSLEDLTLLGAEVGAQLVPGAVRPLPGPFVEPDEHQKLTASYELATIAERGKPASTLQFDGTLAPPLVKPDLVLALLPIPTDSKGTQRCADFADTQPNTALARTEVRNDFTFENLDPRSPMQTVDRFPIGSPDKISELQFRPLGVRVTLPALADSILAQVANLGGAAVRVQAFNASGASVGNAQTSQSGVIQQLTINAPGIASVVISGGNGESVMQRICFTPRPAASNLNDLIPSSRRLPRMDGRDLPLVTGRTVAGQTVEWPGKAIGQVGSGANLCTLVRYVAPSDGPWRSVRVAPWPKSRIGVVSTCGLTWAAAQAAAQDQQARQDFVKTWNDHADGDLPARANLLDANSTYEIQVQWEYQGWQRTEDEPEPPPPPDNGWLAGGTEAFRFRTAVATSAPVNAPPVDFRNESSFDPRGIARYLLKFEPDGEGTPHFLNDPIRVHFSVDHLDALLAKYNRQLVLKLRRTDPPAGSLAAVGGHPPDVSHTKVVKPLSKDLLALSDQRIVTAAEAAPCLSGPANLGGSTIEISAPLDPNAEYDLLLVAAPANNPTSDSVLIARAHFRTSQYHTVDDLLDDLGFGVASPAAVVPRDAFIAPVLPAAVHLADDTALDQALVEIGLDPWPLATASRTVALWQIGPDLKLAGLLMESGEAVNRADRAALLDARIGSQTFSVVRSNASGTRVLLRPPAPIPVDGESILQTRVQEPAGIKVGQRFLKPPRQL